MRTDLWLTEGVLMQALCLDPADLITAFCRARIDATDFRKASENRYVFYVPAASASQAVKEGVLCGAEITILRRRGFLHFVRRFRKRAYLLLIPIPLLLAFVWLSTCLWEIEVSGNETLTRAEILTALESVGVYPGVSGLRLDIAQIRSRMQSALSKLIWCTVQVHGSRALVVVRERRLPPGIVNESLDLEVAARRTGTVDSVSVWMGSTLVKRGDTVLRGQTLISGIMRDRQDKTRIVHAMGRVMAWTWYEKCMELPMAVQEKIYTGEEKRFYSLKIGDLRLNFYNGSSIPRYSYDKIYEEKRITVFGLPLPVCLQRTECRAYSLCVRELSLEEGAAILEERLLAWLQNTAPDAEILKTDFCHEMADGCLRVAMLAQCREDIGTERRIGS